MICRNGRHFIANCGIKRGGDVGTARGFFEVFWRWSRVGCQSGRRCSARLSHTKARSGNIQFPLPPQVLPDNSPASPPPEVRARLMNRALQDEDQEGRDPEEPPLSTSLQKRADPKEPPLSNSLRHLMRSLPHSVVVLTTSTIHPSHSIETKTSKASTSPRDYRGMTLSSFTSLSLTPEPIITFNIKRPSRTFNALCRSRHFLIHILEASENGMNIAAAFTKGNADDLSLFLNNKDAFEVEEWSVQKGNCAEFKIPMLKSDGVVKVLKCIVMEETLRKGGLIPVGDHVLVVGKVEEIFGGKGDRAKSGLCYADGMYRRIGDVIMGKKVRKE